MADTWGSSISRPQFFKHTALQRVVLATAHDMDPKDDNILFVDEPGAFPLVVAINASGIQFFRAVQRRHLLNIAEKNIGTEIKGLKHGDDGGAAVAGAQNGDFHFVPAHFAQ